ncbi:MAG: hypothetical protein WD691_03145 [Acidimicrobiales bacterium]
MALSEKIRSSIYQQLSELLGEEEAAALLSQFPASDLDVPVTKEFVRAELAELEARMGERFRQQTMWMAGTMLTGVGVATAVTSLVTSLLT